MEVINYLDPTRDVLGSFLVCISSCPPNKLEVNIWLIRSCSCTFSAS